MIGWWKHADDPNVLFLRFEDLKKVKSVSRLFFPISAPLNFSTLRKIVRATI